MNYILDSKPLFLLTAILFLSVTVSCNAQRAENDKQKSKTEMNSQTTIKIKMSVNGMSCMGCVANVKKTIQELEGVQEVKVSLEAKEAIVTFVNAKIEPEQIQEAVNKKGFKAGKPEMEKVQ